MIITRERLRGLILAFVIATSFLFFIYLFFPIARHANVSFLFVPSSAIHMQKPPMVHAAGTQSAAALQQQQQITQQPAASGEAYFMKINLRSVEGKHSI